MTSADLADRVSGSLALGPAGVDGLSSRPPRVGPSRRSWARELAWFTVPLALCPLVAVLRPGDGAIAMERGRRLLEWQRSLGVAIEPSVHGWFSARPVLAAAVMIFYLAAHLSAVIATACWLAARRPQAYLRFRRTFATAQVITIATYVAVPVAPLRMVLTGNTSAAGATWTRSIQYEFAAMPSGHVVFALVVGVAVWRHAPPRWRWLGVAHASCTLVAVVATAHHLLADAAVAALVVVAGAFLVRVTDAVPERTRVTLGLVTNRGSGAV